MGGSHKHLKAIRTQSFKNVNTSNNKSAAYIKRYGRAIGMSESVRYTLAKGPDGTRGFYSRRKVLSAMANEYVPGQY